MDRSIRSRIMVCYGLCAIAHSEVHSRQLERATGTLEAIRKNLQEINLLTSPETTNALPELREMLGELDRFAWDLNREICRGVVC